MVTIVLLNVAFTCATPVTTFFFSFFRARGAALAILLGYLFLSCNRARRTFPGTGIGVRPLTANRQTTAVPQSTVTAKIRQALDVHRDFAPKITLDDIIAVDDLANLNDFRLGQIADAAILTDPDFLADILGIRGTDAMNVAQRDFDAFVGRNVNPGDTGHGILLFDERRAHKDGA